MADLSPSIIEHYHEVISILDPRRATLSFHGKELPNGYRVDSAAHRGAPSPFLPSLCPSVIPSFELCGQRDEFFDGHLHGDSSDEFHEVVSNGREG